MADPAIEYKISSHARHIRITVQPKGIVTVTVPKNASRFAAERFVRAKSAWIKKQQEYFLSRPEPDVLPRMRRSKREYLEQKAAAASLVRDRLRHFNAKYGFSYGAVSIRNQKTRWGSCSRRRTLSFNYKIVFLNPEQQDYIVVHELCHLKEFNHSPAFWALVAECIPDHKKIRRSLRGTL